MEFKLEKSKRIETWGSGLNQYELLKLKVDY